MALAKFLGGFIVGTALCIAGLAFAQQTETFTNYLIGLGSASSLGGTETIPILQAGGTKGTTPNAIGILGAGVFNVRLGYGAVGDGSTDNSTAITNAFTASNAFTNGTPTVYFDCNTNTTTCVYNYGGSGTSPINPTQATNVECAKGTTLNYTGTAHAIDVGASGLSSSTIDTGHYTIKNCRFTGGANYTAGIYLNNFIIQVSILFNTFNNFGNRTGYNIVQSGNNWDTLVMGNAWYDHDGLTRNILDGHTATNSDLRFTSNLMECLTAAPGNAACSVSTVGIGLWIFTGTIDNNIIQFHDPLIRISSCQSCGGGIGVHITNNHLEGNSGALTPGITFGDPGTAGQNLTNNGIVISDNLIFWPSAANVPVIGPETASSGNFSLFSAVINHNFFASAPGAGATAYINTNSGVSNTVGQNYTVGGVTLTRASSPPVVDSGANANTYFTTYTGKNGAIASRIPSWDTNGVYIGSATYTEMDGILLCANSTSSNTMTCNMFGGTNGVSLTPTAGSAIIFSTTFVNTGSVTLNINSTGANTIKKNSGTANLVSGDLKANVPYLLTFDGTNWNININNGVTELTALTFSTLPTGVQGMQATITDGLAANCGDSACSAFGTTVTGGTGALKLLIWYNGTNWTLIGK